ncbi:MAG: hypothetical protein E6R08_10100 [Nevskiaceae bacterium]|nr:MAG: hypothetical protein E6R08_10100 [Nevskiaceae bacterium]
MIPVPRLTLLGLMLLAATGATPAATTCGGGTYGSTTITIPVGTTKPVNGFLMCFPVGTTGMFDWGQCPSATHTYADVTCHGDGSDITACVTTAHPSSDSCGLPGVSPVAIKSTSKPTAANTFSLACSAPSASGVDWQSGACTWDCISTTAY